MHLACELPHLNQYIMGNWLFRKSFLAFQRCLGPSVLCKDLQPYESNPNTFLHVSTQHSQGSYHFTDFTGLFTSQNALCQRGKSYKTPNSFKYFWYYLRMFITLQEFYVDIYQKQNILGKYTLQIAC